MSAWSVWSAMGLYPQVPGRAELLLSSPLFETIVIRRGNKSQITILSPEATATTTYVKTLKVNGKASNRPWPPESLVTSGGRLDFTLSTQPNKSWGASASDVPPSFAP